MTFEDGLLLGLIGCTLTVVGFGYAYHKASQKKEEEDEENDLF
jgi:hypothetical protein|tara:strand:+ start:559 stop:687 length:129 start_codon:yes stop_codon:yes gene_type:complete